MGERRRVTAVTCEHRERLDRVVIAGVVAVWAFVGHFTVEVPLQDDFSRCWYLQLAVGAVRYLGAAATQQAGKAVLGKRVWYRCHRGEQGRRIGAQRDHHWKRFAGVGLLPFAKVQCTAALRQPTHDQAVRPQQLHAIDTEILPFLVRAPGDHQWPGNQWRNIFRPAGLYWQQAQIDIRTFQAILSTGCPADGFWRHRQGLPKYGQFVPGIPHAFGRVRLTQKRQQFTNFSEVGNVFAPMPRATRCTVPNRLASSGIDDLPVFSNSRAGPPRFRTRREISVTSSLGSTAAVSSMNSLINLSGVVRGLPPGILLVSGDVLLVYDHLQLSFQRRGVTGVSVATSAEMGTRHGVYVNSPGSRDVSAFLHKPSIDLLTQWQAVDESGRVQIDTGLVWFDAPTALRFARLAENAQIARLCGLVNAQADGGQPSPLNLYSDLLLPLAESTQFADYLSDSSDGPATPALQSARRVIWEQVRGARFSVERLQPAVFMHFGTSEEYWQMLAADRQLADICNWTRHASSWLADGEEAHGDAYVLVNTALISRHLTWKQTRTSVDWPSRPTPNTRCHTSRYWRWIAILAQISHGKGAVSSPACIHSNLLPCAVSMFYINFR